MESWELELEKQFKSENKEENHVNNIKFLYSCFFVLGICLLLAIDFKTDHLFFSKIKDFFSTKEEIEIKEKEDNEEKMELMINELKNEIYKLEKDTEDNSEKIALLGVLVNENFYIIKNNYDKNKIILFKRNWSLDKKPIYLELDDKDLEFLKDKTNN